jgi:CRISPR-associated protein Cas2
MHLNDYIVSYDICDRKRLAKLAKLLEKIAIRIQKSIFLLKASKNELLGLINSIKDIINEEQDDVRIYKINIEKSLHLASATDLKNPMILV